MSVPVSVCSSVTMLMFMFVMFAYVYDVYDDVFML